MSPFAQLIPGRNSLPSFSGAYVWLAVAGLVLVLLAVAFAYLVARREWHWVGRLLHHPVLRSVDDWLARRLPKIWTFVRGRLTLQAWHGLTLTVAFGIIFIAVYAFAAITHGWTSQADLYEIDRQVYEWLAAPAPGGAVQAMRLLTHLGDILTVTVLGLAISAYLWNRDERRRLATFLLVIIPGEALLWTLKLIFSRARPEEQLASALGHSFPSGHSFTAMVFYGFLIYLTWRTAARDAVRIPLTILFTVIIFLVGLSRIILRVHWVSDVIGGFAIGLAWLVCSIVITRTVTSYRASRKARPGPG